MFKFFKKPQVDELENAEEWETFAYEDEAPAFLQQAAQNNAQRSIAEIELTISNLEEFLVLTYENLSDLKAQIEHLKNQEKPDANMGYESRREIATRQTKLAAMLTS